MSFAYSNIFNRAVIHGNPDAAKTLKGFQRRCGVVREAIKEAKKQYDDDLRKLGEEYSAKAFDRERKPLDADYNALVVFAKKRCFDDLQSILDGKRAEFSKRSGAPTEEQLRLLQVLSMRSQLTAGEIANTIDKLNDNIPALRLLREISKNHGIPFPDVADTEVFEQNMSEAEDFCKRMIDSVTKTDDKALNSFEYGFFLRPELRTAADNYFNALDGSIFTAPQVSADEKPAEEKGEKPNAVKVYLRGDENLAGIAVQFGIDSSEIRKANPGYDFGQMQHGDSIIVPAGTLRVSHDRGAVVEGQCVPTYYKPAPKDGDSIDLV